MSQTIRLPRGLLLATLAAGAACSSQPLPLSAQAGSSVALAVAGEASYGTTLGYDGTLLAAAGRHDDQRGELLFVLRDPASGAEHPLETQLVTRTRPDPASDAGLASRIADELALYGIAQPLALLRIPAATPPGRYDVEIRRRRRLAGGGFESLPGPPYAQSLHVLPAQVNGVVGAPTALLGFAGAVELDVTRHLAALVPHPKLVLRLPASPRPAAAQLVISYPAAKLEILGAFEEQHLGHGSVVGWRNDAAAGRVTLELVDPTFSVSALALAFELRDAQGAGRAQLGDFALLSTRLYDAAGALQGGAVGLGPIR